MRILTSTVILAVALAVAAPASAQGTGVSSSTQKKPAVTAKPSTAKPAPKPKRGFRGFFVLDTEMMTASKSFEAITGSSTLVGYGGGGEVANLWRHLFVRGSVAQASTSGERVIILSGSVIPTGVGIDVGLRTVEIGGGWRFPIRQHPRFTPYAGAGVLFVNYTEDSQFAESADNVSESFTGYAFQGGLDLTLTKWIYAAVEAQYRLVPDALGGAGVSKTYGDTDLGGFAFRVMFGVKWPAEKLPAKPAKPAPKK